MNTIQKIKLDNIQWIQIYDNIVKYYIQTFLHHNTTTYFGENTNIIFLNGISCITNIFMISYIKTQNVNLTRKYCIEGSHYYLEYFCRFYSSFKHSTIQNVLNIDKILNLEAVQEAIAQTYKKSILSFDFSLKNPLSKEMDSIFEILKPTCFALFYETQDKMTTETRLKNIEKNLLSRLTPIISK